MGTVNINTNIIGISSNKFSPNNLHPVFWLKDLNTPVNGYWVDYSGNNKQIQAATTTVANDSLIMPANDSQIISALKRLGVYSKYYTNNSTPIKVPIREVAQVSRMLSKVASGSLVTGTTYNVKGDSIVHNSITYNAGDSFIAANANFSGSGTVITGLDNASFFNAKNKTHFVVYNSTQSEQNCNNIYKYIFDYMPVTQMSDSFAITLRGTGSITFDWDDSTTNTYTLSTSADTNITHTWTTRTGLQKNVKVSGNYLGITKLVNNGTGATSQYTLRCSGMALTFLQLNSCPLISVTGSITGMALTYLVLASGPLISVTGSITGMVLTYLTLYSCPLISVTGSITGMALTYLALGICPLISVTGSITGMALTYLALASGTLISVTGSINSISVSTTSINVVNQYLTYPGGALPAWNIAITLQCYWTSDMVDAFLIAFALVAPTVTGKTINLAGTNAARTSASASAVTAIQNKGFSVLTN